MMILLTRSAVLGALLVATAACATPTRQDAARSAPARQPSPAEPTPLYTTALGSFSQKILTRSPEAQAYFDQGFQMVYAFAKRDAVKSFREAQKKDPGCAMCYWGEAWALGPYLNGSMRAADAPRAFAAR